MGDPSGRRGRRPKQQDTAWEKAKDLLTYRPHSVQQLRQKLLRKGYEAQDIEEALGRCEEYKLVDDGVFGREVLEQLALRRGWSPLRARGELQRRGLSSELAQDLVNEAYTAEATAGAARQALTSWLRGRELGEGEIRLKAMAAMQRRGFSTDVVRAAVAALQEEREG